MSAVMQRTRGLEEKVYHSPPNKSVFQQVQQTRKHFNDGSLYSQLLNQFDNESLARTYIQIRAEQAGITSLEDLTKALKYLADIESLSVYEARYDKPDKLNRGILEKDSELTGVQLKDFARLLLNDKKIKFKRRISEAQDYYRKRFAQERAEGRNSLYKSALASKVIAEVGFANLAQRFGRKNALAIAQMTLGYDSLIDFIEKERYKVERYMQENPNGKARYAEFDSGKRKAKDFTAYDFLSREAETPEKQSEIFHNVFRFFVNEYTMQQRERIQKLIKAQESEERRFRKYYSTAPTPKQPSSRPSSLWSRIKRGAAAVYSTL